MYFHLWHEIPAPQLSMKWRGKPVRQQQQSSNKTWGKMEQPWLLTCPIKDQVERSISRHTLEEKWNNGCRPHQSSFCEKLAESPFKKTKSWLHGSSTDTGEMAMSGTRNIIGTFRSFKNYVPIYINHKSTANIGDGIGKELNPISFDRGGEEDLEVNSKKIFNWILVKF